MAKFFKCVQNKSTGLLKFIYECPITRWKLARKCSRITKARIVKLEKRIIQLKLQMSLKTAYLPTIGIWSSGHHQPFKGKMGKRSGIWTPCNPMMWFNSRQFFIELIRSYFDNWQKKTTNLSKFFFNTIEQFSLCYTEILEYRGIQFHPVPLNSIKLATDRLV